MGFRDNVIRALGGEVDTNSVKAPAEVVQNNVELPATNTPTGFNRPRIDASTTKLFDNTDLAKEEIYTGVVYRAITTIANRTAQVLINNTILVDSSGEEIELENNPYWNAIQESPTFTQFEFFYGMATYLQLGGFAPILAVRNFNMGADYQPTSVGDIKELKLLSPYNLKLLLSDEDDALIGYEEVIKMHNGQTKTRKLGIPHVIPAKMFNPFDNLLGFGVTTAANDYQYTARAAGKYTRRAMRNNISASGIITVNKQLDGTMRENFKNEMKSRYASEAADGSPILAFGADAMSWQDLRQDMDKMALEKIHDMNMEDLLTVMGVSKTVMGIEQSGVTRETSRVQQDLLMLNIVMPLAQAILDEFNQDFRNYYPNQWKSSKKQTLQLDSPVSKDYESEKIENETLDVKLDVAKKMWQMGATRESIAEALELPEELEWEDEPRWGGGGTAIGGDGTGNNPADQVPSGTGLGEETPLEEEEAGTEQNQVAISTIPTAKNTLSMEQVVEIKRLREQTYTKIAEHELNYVEAYIDALSDAMQQNSTLPDPEKQKYMDELKTILSGYYAAVVPVLGQAVADFRRRQYGLATTFEMDEAIRNMIRERVSKTSLAHFDTVDNQLTNLLKQALDEGWGRDKMAREVRKTFTDSISKASAKRLTVTETNNAFNKSQYWADQMFLKQHNLEDRAYKQWVTYSPDPCPHCQALAEQAPIPFDKPFINVGESFGAEYTKQDGTKTVRYITPNEDFGAVEDGNAHPNCNCKYRLVIKFN